MFKIKNLIKSFGKQCVLNDLSLDLASNGVTVIVGLNGSGKTIFLNIIANLIKYDTGEITLDNYPIGSVEYKKNMFYIPSDSYLPEYLTGNEYAMFVLSKYTQANRAIFIQLSSIFEMTEALDKSIESYSFGMKKKLQIAVALSLDVKYLLADEVFSGLDIETVIFTQELFELYSLKHKILLVSHERNIIDKFSDNILLMTKGKLTEFKGTPDELYKYIYEQGQVTKKLQDIKKFI